MGALRLRGIISASIALPWLTMYFACLFLFYAAQPRRWKDHDLPYISGMLGDQYDDPVRGRWRILAWCGAILLTIPPRVFVWATIQRLRALLVWMPPYLIVWVLTVLSAGWDAHPHTNPLRHWGISGGVIHFFFSAVFFVTAGAESFYLNLKRMFPDQSQQIKRFLATYIITYCVLFALNKWIQKLSWLGHITLPMFEHLMLFGHVWADSYGTATLLEGTFMVEPLQQQYASLAQAEENDDGVLMSPALKR